MSAPMLTEIERPRISVSHIYAWGVHLYTAMGLVVAGAIAYVLVSDDPQRFRDAFLLMAVGLIIDGTDGWFARRVRVTEVLPGFDGRRLDDLVDFLNYTCLPLLLIYQADLLPERQSGWLLVPLLASAYGFCQVSAKTDDGFFLGFPSYWNLVAFYLYCATAAGVGHGDNTSGPVCADVRAGPLLVSHATWRAESGLDHPGRRVGRVHDRHIMALGRHAVRQPDGATTDVAVTLLPGLLHAGVVGSVGALLADAAAGEALRLARPARQTA